MSIIKTISWVSTALTVWGIVSRLIKDEPTPTKKRRTTARKTKTKHA